MIRRQLISALTQTNTTSRPAIFKAYALTTVLSDTTMSQRLAKDALDSTRLL